MYSCGLSYASLSTLTYALPLELCIDLHYPLVYLPQYIRSHHIILHRKKEQARRLSREPRLNPIEQCFGEMNNGGFFKYHSLRFLFV